MFDSDIVSFNAAVNTFNLATGSSYPTVDSVPLYSEIPAYPAGGPSPPNLIDIVTFDTLAAGFNNDVLFFDFGSLDRPSFAGDVATFNGVISNFNSRGASPPYALVLSPSTYPYEPLVTDPTPEPATLSLLVTGGALLWVAGLRKKRRGEMSGESQETRSDAARCQSSSAFRAHLTA